MIRNTGDYNRCKRDYEKEGAKIFCGNLLFSEVLTNLSD